jgi:hypothetical protein
MFPWDKIWPEIWRQGPAVVILFLILAGSFAGVWVWGSLYRDMRLERDQIQREKNGCQKEMIEARAVALDALRRLERRNQWRPRAEDTQAVDRLKGRIEALDVPSPSPTP